MPYDYAFIVERRKHADDKVKVDSSTLVNWPKALVHCKDQESFNALMLLLPEDKKVEVRKEMWAIQYLSLRSRYANCSSGIYKVSSPVPLNTYDIENIINLQEKSWEWLKSAKI